MLFDGRIRGRSRHQVVQLGDGARLAQDDQGVSSFDLGLGMGVEDHLAMVFFDADDDDADLLAESGADQGLTHKG